MTPPILRSVAKSLIDTTTRRSDFPYNFIPQPLTTGDRIVAWSARIISLALGVGTGYNYGGLYPNKYLEDDWQFQLDLYHDYEALNKRKERMAKP